MDKKTLEKGSLFSPNAVLYNNEVCGFLLKETNRGILLHIFDEREKETTAFFPWTEKFIVAPNFFGRDGLLKFMVIYRGETDNLSLTAIELLENKQEILAELLLTPLKCRSKEDLIIARLTDQKLLTKIAIEAKDSPFSKPPLLQKAINKITDGELLLKIVKANCSASFMALVELQGNYELIAQIARNPEFHLSYREIAIDMLIEAFRKDEDPRVFGQKVLAQIAETDPEEAIREKAKEAIEKNP